MIGLDTAKSMFQVHAVNGAGKAEIRCKLRRSELIAFFERQEACTVVMEACGAAHHWARMLTGLGHDVKLIAPEAVRSFVKKGKKNDAADAAVICEAASRPDVRFVTAKSSKQQGILALHSTRSLLVKQQTMLANAMRGLAAEFGFTVPLGIDRLEDLMALVDAEKDVAWPMWCYRLPRRAGRRACSPTTAGRRSAKMRCVQPSRPQRSRRTCTRRPCQNPPAGEGSCCAIVTMGGCIPGKPEQLRGTGT